MSGGGSMIDREQLRAFAEKRAKMAFVGATAAELELARGVLALDDALTAAEQGAVFDAALLQEADARAEAAEAALAAAREALRTAGPPREEPMSEPRQICGVVMHSSWHEPVACAYKPGHEGPHSWASLPQFPTPNAINDAMSKRRKMR